MICVHTIRKLKPGAFERFAETFRPDAHGARTGWVRFTMMHGLTDPDEVITFGVFDGSLEQMRASQDAEGYQERIDAGASLVERVISSGVYEITLDIEPSPDPG